MSNIKTAEELIETLRSFGEDCSDADMCKDCQASGFCDKGWTPGEVIQLIEHLAWKACENCHICQTTAEKHPLDCEIIETEVEA